MYVSQLFYESQMMLSRAALQIMLSHLEVTDLCSLAWTGTLPYPRAHTLAHTRLHSLTRAALRVVRDWLLS